MTKLLRRQAVTEITGMPRTTLYLAMKAGKFPKPVAIGKRAVAWRSDEVEAWVNERLRRG